MARSESSGKGVYCIEVIIAYRLPAWFLGGSHGRQTALISVSLFKVNTDYVLLVLQACLPDHSPIFDIGLLAR